MRKYREKPRDNKVVKYSVTVGDPDINLVNYDINCRVNHTEMVLLIIWKERNTQ